MVQLSLYANDSVAYLETTSGLGQAGSNSLRFNVVRTPESDDWAKVWDINIYTKAN